jgi:cytidylate kinase
VALGVTALAFVLALDGPAGAGKSVVATRLARRLGWPVVDTGAIYRAVTLASFRAGLNLQDEQAIGKVAAALDLSVGPPTNPRFEYSIRLYGEDVTPLLFRVEIDRAVSIVAAHPRVRSAVLPVQRTAATGDAVVVGRDIGTVVFPDAKLKIYLDASSEVRAARRLAQLLERGLTASFDDVHADVIRRDGIDRRRRTAPLRAAHDAIIINTDARGIDEVVDQLDKLVSDRKRECKVQHSPATDRG